MNKYKPTKIEQLHNAIQQIDFDDTTTKKQKIKIINYILEHKNKINFMRTYLDDIKKELQII